MQRNLHNKIGLLKDISRVLEAKREIQPSDREELLSLFNIIISALEKTDGYIEADELVNAHAFGPVLDQALLALLKQQTDELDALRKLSLNLTSSLEMNTVLDAIVHEAMQLVRSTRAVHIFLYKNGLLEFGAIMREDGKEVPFSTPRKDGLTYTVARGGETIVVENIRGHPLYVHASPEWSGSIIGIPLKMGQTVVGVMNLSRSTTGGFTTSEVRLLSLLANQAAVAISNASLHQVIRIKAYTDPLTGLPNRRALDERIEKEVNLARRSNQNFAILMMDLDGFKAVNDSYGHHFGDRILRLFSDHISQGLRSTDFLARYGGDEFTLLMSQTALASALLVADKILEKTRSFTAPAPDGKFIRLGISGGIAVYPIHKRTATELMRAADEALYRAKRRERGKFFAAESPTGPHPRIS